jgi:hypothetical protein
MTPPTSLASLLGPLTAMFVDGPAHGATMPLEVESTGFPPVHLSLPGPASGIEHVYVADARDPGPLIRYRYRGPIAAATS